MGFRQTRYISTDIVESSLELLTGKLRQFLQKLSAHHMSVVSFPDDNDK